MTTPSLRERALLVNLSISTFNPTKIDKVATLETLIKHEASRKAGAFVKSLLTKESIGPVETAAGRIRSAYYRFTAPWAENVRVLPSDLWEEFSSTMRELRSAFDEEVGKFLLDYSAHLEKSKAQLGNLWASADYPTVEEARARFSVNLNWFPISDAPDFRISLPGDGLAQIQADNEATTSEGTSQVRQDILNRLGKALLAVTEKLKDPDPLFRNSLIGNLKEACEIIPKLNIMGDESVLRLVSEAEEVAKVDPDSIRESDDVRVKTRQTAEDILRNMGMAA